MSGSGVLTRSLQKVWPDAKFKTVLIGKRGIDTGKAKQFYAPEPFEKEARITPPFPSCSNYDAKAWQFFKRYAKPGALFWNVAS